MIPIVLGDVRIALVQLPVLIDVDEPMGPVSFGITQIPVHPVGKKPVVAAGGVALAVGQHAVAVVVVLVALVVLVIVVGSGELAGGIAGVIRHAVHRVDILRHPPGGFEGPGLLDEGRFAAEVAQPPQTTGIVIGVFAFCDKLRAGQVGVAGERLELGDAGNGSRDLPQSQGRYAKELFAGISISTACRGVQ